MGDHYDITPRGSDLVSLQRQMRRTILAYACELAGLIADNDPAAPVGAIRAIGDTYPELQQLIRQTQAIQAYREHGRMRRVCCVCGVRSDAVAMAGGYMRCPQHTPHESPRHEPPSWVGQGGAV